MRKFIIDTDVGSDDAVALMLALLDENIEVLGITTVCGNVELPLATKNALATLEVCKSSVPVYVGASRPLMRELVTAVNVHGQDGMGDCGLIHPTSVPHAGRAVDFILETVSKYEGEVEIVTLGPVTNIATALYLDSETMKKTKRIWAMATSGFGAGNTTPVAEFNVYADAEAFARMLSSGIPITIAGFDLCLGEPALQDNDLRELLGASAVARFAVACNKGLREYNIRKNKRPFVDLPDAVAMGIALWDDIVLDAPQIFCHTCTERGATYGQTVLYDSAEVLAVDSEIPQPNCTVVRKINPELFKRRMIDRLKKSC